ncbi:hypothetical protein EV715DRAFT_201360 [Schizophyllum commune]
MLVKISLNVMAAHALNPEPRLLESTLSDSASTEDAASAAIMTAFEQLCEQEDSAEHPDSLGLCITIGRGDINVSRDVRESYNKPIANLFNILDKYKRMSNRVVMLIFDVQIPLTLGSMQAFPLPEHIYHVRVLGLGCAPSCDKHMRTFWKRRVFGWAKRERPLGSPKVKFMTIAFSSNEAYGQPIPAVVRVGSSTDGSISATPRYSTNSRPPLSDNVMMEVLEDARRADLPRRDGDRIKMEDLAKKWDGK